jgi:hypothetical protein
MPILFLGIAMLTVDKYSYPNQATFAEALEIAKTAIAKYDGKMSNVALAEALGYKTPKADAISGYIFRRFDDLCAYGLMKRQRGFVKTTDIAEQALDPFDAKRAREGKAKAILQMPIVKDAFTQWNGEIPQETAFQSKLTDLLGGNWKEAQKHAETLKKLFIEVFPYLKATPEMPPTPPTGAGAGGDRINMNAGQEQGDMTVSARGKNFGFTKTLPFTKDGITQLKKLIDFLETQISEDTAKETTKTKQQN